MMSVRVALMRKRFLAGAAAIAAVIGIGLASPAHATTAGPHPAPVAHAYMDHSNGHLALGAPAGHMKIAGKYITTYYWPESSVNGGTSGYVVDNTNDGGNGTQQQVWTPNGNRQQGWYLACFLSDCSYYWIINGNGKCLDDTNGSSANGTKVQVWTCISGDYNQAWFYNKYSGSNGNLAMWINYNGACLDDQHPYTDGGKIQMWQCNFPPNNDNAEAWQVPAPTW